MAINFVSDQTAMSAQVKQVYVKVVKLTYANFSTTNTDALLAVLPADISIIGFRSWVKTALSGNGVATPTLALGASSGAADFMAANDFPQEAAGTAEYLTPVLLQMSPYDINWRTDTKIYGRGVCTVGNPTAGEMYLAIEYVR